MSDRQASSRTIPLGLVMMAGSAFCLSVMSLLVKLVGRRLPVFELVMVRSLFMLVFAFSHLRWLDHDLWGTQRKLLVVRGTLGFFALSCFYYAVTHLPLADATLLHYLNPVFVAIIAALLIGERLRPLEAGGIVASLVGVALIQQPPFLFGGEGRLALFPVVVALGGALFSAGAYVTIRHLRSTEHPIVIVFYYSLIAAPASILIAAPALKMPRGWEWLALVGIGVTTYLAQVLLTNGLHREKAGRATAVTYLHVVFAFGWDMLVFGLFPTWLSICGAILIVGSALTIALLRARESEEAESEAAAREPGRE